MPKNCIFFFLTLPLLRYILHLLSGAAMRSKGCLYPILLSPARISELNVVSKTNDGEYQVFFVKYP